MDTMLRKALRKYSALRQQVDNVLLGEEGDIWEAELKKFLARRQCWTPSQSVAEEQAIVAPVTPPSNILIIDRSNGRLDPAGFDPALSDWKTAEDFDSRLLSVTQVDMSKLIRVHMLKPGEPWIIGEDRLKSMLAVGHMGFDLRPMQLLWEDYLRCKASECGVTGSILEKHFREAGYVDAMGQPLLSPFGSRYVLFFCRIGGESPRWIWSCRRLDSQWYAVYPSVAWASPLG